jgi:hypothetical protein
MADKYAQNLEYIARSMGQDLLPFISSADRVRGLPLDDILNALGDEDRQALRELLDDQENGT